jgi:hypothetical protein
MISILDEFIWHDVVIYLFEFKKFDKVLFFSIDAPSSGQPFSNQDSSGSLSAAATFYGVKIVKTENMKQLLKQEFESWEAEIWDGEIYKNDGSRGLKLSAIIEYNKGENQYLHIEFSYTNVDIKLIASRYE